MISLHMIFSGFFETDSKLKDSFFKVADTERDRFRFGYTSNAEVLKKAGYTEWVVMPLIDPFRMDKESSSTESISSFSDIVVFVPTKLHNKFDPNEFKYDGNYDTDKIKAFLVSET